ncbi:MAG: peptide chain release factor N(5)-glutamine methyltransferase [Ruminococcaceae bacterium]|nr:peptide chain release factor N(5)-glutamine methyltransferase [Oscillospiraceae bacterium]
MRGKFVKMLRRDLYRRIKDALLTAGFPLIDAREIYRIASGKNIFDTNFDEMADRPEVETAKKLTEKRMSGYPIQYICGSWSFLDFELEVNENVLIPRPETESVANCAIEIIKNSRMKRNINVVDLCSGSGCIAIAISREIGNASVTAVEISAGAYEVLTRNIKKLAPRVIPVLDDIFHYSETIEDSCLDMIVSNPPYVSLNDYSALQKELYYEPRIALCDEGDGLDYYRKISEEYKRKLKKRGHIVFEVGDNMSDEVSLILREYGYGNIKTMKDGFLNPRIVMAVND